MNKSYIQIVAFFALFFSQLYCGYHRETSQEFTERVYKDIMKNLGRKTGLLPKQTFVEKTEKKLEDMIPEFSGDNGEKILMVVAGVGALIAGILSLKYMYGQMKRFKFYLSTHYFSGQPVPGTFDGECRRLYESYNEWFMTWIIKPDLFRSGNWEKLRDKIREAMFLAIEKKSDNQKV